MDSCGGWLITHEDGSVTCVEPDCTDLSALRHDWRALCADLDELCEECMEPVADRQWRAA